MSLPVHITYVGSEASRGLEIFVREQAAKLAAFDGGITGFRCELSYTARTGHQGHAFHVCLEIDLAGLSTIVVRRDPGRDHAHGDAHVAIRDAFAAARRQLRGRLADVAPVVAASGLRPS